jgi:diguanylate cyclase (GGDEF)-like protein
MKSHSKESAIRVAISYFVFSAVWIFGSDYLLYLISEDIFEYRYVSTIKGMIFILLSAYIIYILVLREIKEINVAQVSIQRLQQFDTLTGLHNRSAFNQTIDTLRDTNQHVTLMLCDINGLKLINEVYGSDIGDKLLQQFSQTITEMVPKDAFISRIGGDEFCIIVEGDHQPSLVSIGQSLQKLTYVSISDFETTVAIGISSTEDDKEAIDMLLSLAEDRMMKNKLLLNESGQNSIIASLLTTLYERSDETEQHSKRLQELCLLIGQDMNLLPTDLDDLQLFALLHDIGKIGISDAILFKPGKLTELEYNIMQQHPIIGYKIASSVLPLEGIAHYILSHHEHWDGSGYPKGLKGLRIPLLSRILSVVDAFDAMTNDRIYQRKRSEQDAIDELIRCKGTQFDPAVIDSFLRVYIPSNEMEL